MSISQGDLSASQVHAQLRQALDQMQHAEESAVLLFAEILRRKLYRELGYSSIQAYAADALGFSESKTYQFLRLAQSLDKLPALKESLATGEIEWTKARTLVRIATSDNEERWIEEARGSSRRELERKIEESRAAARSAQWPAGAQASLLAAADAGPAVPVEEAERALCQQGPEAEVSVTLRLTPLQKAHLEAMIEKIRKRSSGATRRASREELILEALASCLESFDTGTPGCDGAETRNPARAQSGEDPEGHSGDCAQAHPGGCTRVQSRVQTAIPYQIIIQECPRCGASSVVTSSGEQALRQASAERIACDARVLEPGKPNRSTIPPAVRRAVLARDGYRCQAKGCGRRHFLEVHHLRPRSQGGGNETDNLITLCSSCHELLHERGLCGFDVDSFVQGAAAPLAPIPEA